jgi:hypothetical protein
VGFSVTCCDGFTHHGERLVAADRTASSNERRQSPAEPIAVAVDIRPWNNEEAASEMFAQFLGKLYFFNLRENLPLILFDYEEKRSRTANGPFKSAC